MSEYFIRLATLLGTDFPEKLPVLGYIAKNVGVRQWRETWNDDAVVVSAEAVIDAAISWEKGGFQFSVGNAVAGQTFFRIEIASDRSSLLTAIADRGEEMAGIVDPPPREGLQIFARADSPLAPSRIQLHDLDLRIRLPKDHALKGKREGNRIKPIADQAAEIAFMRGTLIIAPDAPKPIQFVPDDDEAVVIDPIYLPNLDIGIEVDKFKLDMSEESGIPEVLARPGYDETWTGLYLETFRIYGMHMLFPTLPEKIDANDPADLIIELSRVVIGFDDGGVSGSLRVQMHTPANDPKVIRGAGFVVELERGNMIRCEVELTLRLERIADPSGPIDHDLQIIGSARFSPDGRLGWDLALNTPNTADEGLLSYGPDAVASIEAVIAAVLLADDLRSGEYLDAILLAGLATLLVKLQHDQQLGFKRLTLDALKLRYREELVAGRILKYLDLIADIQLLISLDLELSALPVVGAFLPNIKTDPGHPLGLLMKGLRVSLAYNIDDFTEAELGADRKVITVGWPSDYLFDLSGQSLMPNSPLVLTKFGFGRWDEGVWVDFGLKVAANDPSTAFSVIPHVFRLYFLANGDFDHATFEGLSVSILVPGVLFMRGRLNLGETITEAALQGWFVSAPGLSLTAYEKRENWQWDVGAQYREATLPDGTETSIVYAWLKTSSGIPNPLLPGTALYGGHFLYGNNSRPALGGDTIERWFTHHEPKNQIEIDKWEGNLDSTAIGFGLVLGTQVDRGRPWNLQVGLLWADSQWLLHGYLNIFKQRPDPADTQAGSLQLLGAWGPGAGHLFGSVRWAESIPADGKVMKLDLGAEILVDDASSQTHFYAGFHWPPERHLKAILFQRYEVSFYLMQDDADVENFAGTGLTLPGFVAALGARFSIEGGRKKGRLKLYFYLRASADLAFTGSDPMLTVVRASVAGGLVAKAYGIGFEFEIAAEFLWVRPQPDLLTGKLKITLDLPWPIPNLHYTLDCSDGADGPTEALETCLEGLTLIPRQPSGVIELDGRPEQPLVPVDPVFALAFSYPTRNGPAVDGNFGITAVGLNAVDTTVTHETSGGHAYTVEVTAIRLWRGAAGTGTLHPGPIPAKWVKQPSDAAGGQPSRRVLELFSLEDIALSRLVGPTAELVGGLVDGWSPCPPTSEPKQFCYSWAEQPLGPMPTVAVITLPELPALTVTVLDEPDGAESMRRYFSWTAQQATVVPFTVMSGVVAALQLPATVGSPLPETPAAPPLELRFAAAHSVLLQMARPPRGRQIVVRFYFNDRLVKEDADGIRMPGLEGRWEHALYSCEGPVNRAVIETALQRNPDSDDVSALLLRVCVVLESEWRQFHDAVASGAMWQDFWSTFTISDPLVLQPASHYSLEVEGGWARVAEGVETPGGTFTRTFEFDTVGLDQMPPRLRGIEQSVDGLSNYDVKTAPPANAVGVYAARPVRIEFRHRRVELVYAAFGRRLAIRLVDDRGNVDARFLNYQPQPANDLPVGEAGWHDVVTDAVCSPGNLDWHWHFPVVKLTDVLHPARRYDASIYAVDGAVTDANDIDLQTTPVIHQFTFRTSNWSSLDDHLAAYLARGPLDEIVSGQAPFGQIAPTLGTAARVSDDVLLAATMTERLGLARREPAAEPELVRVWQRTPGGEQLIGMILDGPEPLPRPLDGGLEIQTAANVPIPTVLLSGTSGTRTLVLFRDGATGLKAIAPEDLRIVVTDAWVAADGTHQVDTAARIIAVPARPAFLEPEGPP